jgi:HPt (histidine-containing phosphotransfer) domain-containing protein
MNDKELRKSIQIILRENFEAFDSGDFDSDEMLGKAQSAAIKDIKGSGDEFEPLGKSDFEKNLDIDSFLKDLKHSPQISSLNEKTKIDRPKDAEGQDITLRARVEDLETGSAGRVVRFGVDDDGKQTVHVEWIGEFGGNIPKSITHPDKIVVRDNNRIVREAEDNSNQSRYMFFSNLEQIKKQAELMLKMNKEEINEILENGHDWAQDHIATAKESVDQVYDFLTNKDQEEEIKGEGIGIGLAMKKGMNVKEEGIGAGLEMKKGMNIKEEEVDEDSLEFRKTAGQRQKSRKGVPLGKHSPHSQAAIKGEGAGIGLAIKNGMNVKPTYGK